ncbi:MAG: hypothetical protein CME63_14995 [Halobacteriovoraceae bacterium]|nr:hypothetical protein [Halobacteriovoraceae bacterium]
MTFVLAVLFISLWLYLIFAGADFGAGILEIFKGKKFQREQEALVNKAMGPVWEANHIWLILALVILFVGFPKLFKEVCIVLHIPITAILIGIVFRGSAFTFRHYDAIKDKSQNWYSGFFAWSSLWTTFWIGVSVGAIMEGHFYVEKVDFFQTYIRPWLSGFPILVGFFLCTLLSYITATFMVAEASSKEGEVRDYLKDLYKRRAQYSIGVAIPIGAVIISYGYFYNIYSLNEFFNNTFTLICLGLSSILLLLQYVVIKKNQLHFLKYIGVTQLSLIFLGVAYNQFPFLIHNEQTHYFLSFYRSAAPDAVIDQLVIALIIVTVIIFPPYIYLMKIFKEETIKA